MDGRLITRELKKAGLKVIRSSSTIIHGYRNFSGGDFYCKTEKSYGCFGKQNDEKMLSIYFDNGNPTIKERIKTELEKLNLKIAYENNSQIIL